MPPLKGFQLHLFSVNEVQPFPFYASKYAILQIAKLADAYEFTVINKSYVIERKQITFYSVACEFLEIYQIN